MQIMVVVVTATVRINFFHLFASFLLLNTSWIIDTLKYADPNTVWSLINEVSKRSWKKLHNLQLVLTYKSLKFCIICMQIFALDILKRMNILFLRIVFTDRAIDGL